MTTITIKKDKSTAAFTFEGHAGDKSVCAGISALFYTAAGYAANKRIVYCLSECKEEGWGRIYLEAGFLKRKMNDLSDFLEIGLRQIEESYPAHCKVVHK